MAGIQTAFNLQKQLLEGEGERGNLSSVASTLVVVFVVLEINQLGSRTVSTSQSVAAFLFE